MQLFEGYRIPDFQAFARQAEKRLRVLNAADTLEVLKMLPSNRCNALTGNRKGQFSIRINDQYCDLYGEYVIDEKFVRE